MIYPMNLRTCLKLFACIGAVSTLQPLRAQSSTDSTVRDPHAVQPERPTIATHAGTVARGWIELEEGGEWDRFDDGTRGFVAPTNLKIGLASRAQLNVLVNLVRDRRTNAPLLFGDLAIGVK